jgi:hypothetical protein
MATHGEEGKTERRPRGSDSGPHLVRRRSMEGCLWRWVVAGNGGRRRRAAVRGRGGEVLGRHGRVTGSIGTSPLMAAGMLGHKTQAARARVWDGDEPMQQRVARRFGVHWQQARSGIASSSGRGSRGVTRAARCERACTASNGGSGESRAGPCVRAGSGLQLEQAARMCSFN